MELPNYTDLGKIYEMNPAAFWQAQDQMDLARQFQAEKYQQEQATTKQLNLSNMFEEQNMPHKLRQSELTNLTTEAELGPKQTKSWIDSQTRDQQLQLQMKEMATKASKADLDGMEYAAQQMAYSPDPNIRAQGEQLLQMHKDFIKMREQNKFTASESAKQRAHAMALENQRAANAEKRAAAAAKLKADAAAARVNEKMTSDQYRAYLLRKAQEARNAGDHEGAAMLYQEAQYVTDLRASERPDPNVGKVDIQAAGVQTMPPRQAPTPPSTQGPISRQLYPNGTPRGEAPPQIPIPQAAADYLKKNPQLRQQFEAKYGPGSAAKILGQ